MALGPDLGGSWVGYVGTSGADLILLRGIDDIQAYALTPDGMYTWGCSE